jgi:hypothetical protein
MRWQRARVRAFSCQLSVGSWQLAVAVAQALRLSQDTMTCSGAGAAQPDMSAWASQKKDENRPDRSGNRQDEALSDVAVNSLALRKRDVKHRIW